MTIPLDPTDRMLRLVLVRAVRRAALLTLTASAACYDGPLYETRPAGDGFGNHDAPDVDDDNDEKAQDAEAPGEPDAGHADPWDGPFEAVHCDGNGEIDFEVPEMRLARSFDYVQIRHRQIEGPGEVQERGVRCAGASEGSSCEDELAALEAERLIDLDVCRGICFDATYALTTRGDEVERFFRAEELRGLLGTIDTRGEALLWLTATRLAPLTCDAAELTAMYTVVATFQAEHAEDTQVRGLMRRIARDETRHAGLAWPLAAWLDPQLSERQWSLVLAAQRAAIAQLARELAVPLAPEVLRMSGMPDCAQGQRLLAELERSLWSPARAA